MRKMFYCALIAAAFIAFQTPDANAQKKQKPRPKLPANVEILRDVEFGKGGGRALKMHIIRPKKADNTPRPVLVWIHGGGWRGGNKESGIRRLAAFANRGYFCATAEYRLSGEAKFPAQIQDCKCAIRYLRAHAKKYNIDPNRIGVWGSSAGGHLVSLLGTSGDVKELEGSGGWESHSSRVQAVCDFCGPSDFIAIMKNSKGASGPVAALFGGPPAEKLKLAKLASPITHATKDDAAFLIVHGDKDTLVPMAQAKLLHEALKKAGVTVTMYVAEGRGHGINGKDVDQRVREFFDKQLNFKAN